MCIVSPMILGSIDGTRTAFAVWALSAAGSCAISPPFVPVDRVILDRNWCEERQDEATKATRGNAKTTRLGRVRSSTDCTQCSFASARGCVCSALRCQGQALDIRCGEMDGSLEQRVRGAPIGQSRGDYGPRFGVHTSVWSQLHISARATRPSTSSLCACACVHAARSFVRSQSNCNWWTLLVVASHVFLHFLLFGLSMHAKNKMH